MKSILFSKPREECLIIGDTRVSYSYEDVLIEDFYNQKNHPYAIYDLNGNLLETNLDCDKPLWVDYCKNIKAIKHSISKYGVNL